MSAWEYQVVRGEDLSSMAPKLNELGAVEWEVVGVVANPVAALTQRIEAVLKRAVLSGAAKRRREALGAMAPAR